ncbi:hypothetical protein ACFSTA_20495 [Ornithinibacillus salinisoli]|uniref:Uncharacterized protein n=1 Tax=Ornithinibacillus salinisoli TaxID=1848459 RepID=A0ABW4W519_9BACI
MRKEFSSLTETLSNIDYMISRVPYYIDGMGGLSNYNGDALAVIDRGTNYEEITYHHLLKIMNLTNRK